MSRTQKTPHGMQGLMIAVVPAPRRSGSGFGGLHRRGLQTLRTLGHFEFDPLAFLQTAETLAGDRRKMDEYVRSPILRCDENMYSLSLSCILPSSNACMRTFSHHLNVKSVDA